MGIDHDGFVTEEKEHEYEYGIVAGFEEETDAISPMEEQIEPQ